MTVASRWYVTVSMGGMRYEEAADPDGSRDAGEWPGRMSVLGVPVARTGVPAVPAAGGHLCQSLSTCQSLQPLRWCARRDPGPGNLRAGAYTLIGRRPTMKKLLAVMLFGMLLGAMTGCRIGECWRESTCARCRPQQTVVVAEPCVVTESCSPCNSCSPCGTCTSCNPCSSCGTPCTSCTSAPVLVPGPVVAH